MPTALVTGASAGLGRALAAALVRRKWTVIGDARDAAALESAAREDGFTAIPGDVTDPAHRASLAEACPSLDLLVNNAGSLGVSPLPPLARYPLPDLEDVYRVNVFAPLALTQLLLPALARGVVINISSDAAVEAYEGWGGYGSAKAALDHLTAILAAEQPDRRFYAVDPGDMNTRLHQEAFPGEDISDRPPPEDSVPGLLALIAGSEPSGRYRAADLAPVGA